jgi:putative ABC transport system permease protein
MLMSVKERTREVGILRSIGTFKNQILQMFLYEAGLIGLIGAIIGTILALIASPILLIAMNGSAEAMLSPSVLAYIPIGILTGLIVCLISGLYPAWKAANLNPVEAMATD